jgi:hypothetical protein
MRGLRLGDPGRPCPAGGRPLGTPKIAVLRPASLYSSETSILLQAFHSSNVCHYAIVSILLDMHHLRRQRFSQPEQ